jgi:hypothetical protein
MKTFIISTGLMLFAAMPIAHGGPAIDRGLSSCYRVTIQTDRVNESNVHQECERNVSRTAQVGARNRAQTHQTGRFNSNGVKQFHFDSRRYFNWQGDDRW